MKILIVTDVPCWQPLRGSSRRIKSLIDHLAASHLVTVCLINQMSLDEWHAARKNMPVPVCGPGQPGKLAAILHRCFSLTRRLWTSPKRAVEEKESSNISQKAPPGRLRDFQSSTIGNYVSGLARREGFELVVLEYVSLAWLAGPIRQTGSSMRVIVDTHDVMHLRNAESTKLNIPIWLDISEQEERDALSKCDAIMAISPEDKQVFCRMLPENQVLLATWSAEFQTSGVLSGNARSKPVSIGFIGSDGHANRLGLEWFLNRCWPMVLEECGGEAVLEIAGPLPDHRHSTHDRPDEDASVRWLGEVSDVASFYSRIQIAINPALLNSGFKIKSLEALAWGVPLVSTSQGLAGLTETVGKGSFAADTPEEFVRTLIALVKDPAARSRASTEALAVVREKFSPSAVYRELDAWIGGER